MVTGTEAPASAAELTDLASSFEQGKPFGFKAGVSYKYTSKTASITRESQPYLQTSQTRNDLYSHYQVPPGQELSRTETIPDLLYTQRRHTMSIDAAIGLFQDLQLGFSLPLVLRDERQYDLAGNAGWNSCAEGNWSCVANSSSTYLDGIYPIVPSDLSGSTIFTPPVRGGSGSDMLDTFNLSLMGAPVSQRRDPTKPTWVIGMEAQISIGNIMAYDNTRRYLTPTGNPNNSTDALIANAAQDDRGYNAVSEGVHRLYFRTALSHRFRYVDPYFGLWYMYPIKRTDDGSPWQPDYGFAQKHADPQQQAGTTFGFEATPYENKSKGIRFGLDFRGGLNFHFLGRGFSEAWELLASSNALICDDQTPLPQSFNYSDTGPRPGVTQITQGTFNPGCRISSDQRPAGDNRALPDKPTAYYQKPYTGLTLIENYLTFTADIGIVVELFHHARLRFSFNYLHDQGHVITQDDAGSTTYPNGTTRVPTDISNNPNQTTCNDSRVDLRCANDWNPGYRAAINQAGRRYRVDDVNVLGTSLMLQAYF